MSVGVHDVVRVGSGSKTATVLELLDGVDEAGQPYVMALLRGARNRVFREEVTHLTVVKKAGAV